MLYWIIILVVAAVLLYFIAHWLFPGLIRAFVGLIGGALVVVTGLFIRRRKS